VSTIGDADQINEFWNKYGEMDENGDQQTIEFDPDMLITEHPPRFQYADHEGRACVTIHFKVDMQAAYEKAKKALEEELIRQMTEAMREQRLRSRL